MGLTSGHHYGQGYDYDHRPQFERSASTSIGEYYDHAQQRHNDHSEYSSTDYSNIDDYSTSSTEYWGFEYYHHEVDIAQPQPSYYLDVRSSSQPSQSTGSNQQTYYYSYRNYMPDFYTYRREGDNNDFVSHRNLMWKWLH